VYEDAKQRAAETSPETGCTPSALPPRDVPGYTLCHYVCGWLDSARGDIPQIATRLTRTDTLGHWRMRWNLGRDRYRVVAGLYAIGTPDNRAPVLLCANYKLSFDLLRRALDGLDAWLLVLDTKGINVWCAAGKGTFGTAEIVRRVTLSGLDEIVSHRTLIAPQLGAPGIAAHLVKKECGFRIVYGPVRAADIKAFLSAGQQATPAMRRVTFSLWERAILTPVELTIFGRKLLWIALLLLLLGGIGEGFFSFGNLWQRGGGAILTGLGGLVAGAVITPLLLPWLPGRAFATKGAMTGGAVAVGALLVYGPTLGVLNGIAFLLSITAVASYCGMNFTGSSTYTSPSGVEKEMRRALPLQMGTLLLAAAFWFAAAF